MRERGRERERDREREEGKRERGRGRERESQVCDNVQVTVQRRQCASDSQESSTAETT